MIGVLDWELSTIGHPLSDLANLLHPFFIPASNEGFFGLKNSKEPLPIPDHEQLIQYYCQKVGCPYPLEKFQFSVAFACFRVSVKKGLRRIDLFYIDSHEHAAFFSYSTLIKLAVILQGIAARVARKQASSAEAKAHGEKFKPMAQLALDFVDQGELASAGASKSSSKL